MKMKLSASGPSASPNKIVFYLGILFVVLGAAIGGGGLLVAALTRQPGIILFAVMFLAMFCGIGGFFAKLGHDALHRDNAVLDHGTPYLAKIYAHEPDYRITLNGQPCITLVVRYLATGQIREARVSTGEVDPVRYPRGATVAIKMHDGVAALVPGSVSDMRIEQEDDLMNPDFDPSGAVSSIGVSCPNCGANIAVPLGMSRYCPYCDSKVSVDGDGRILGQ